VVDQIRSATQESGLRAGGDGSRRGSSRTPLPGFADRDFLDGGDDVRVGAAPAQVPAHPFPNFVVVELWPRAQVRVTTLGQPATTSVSIPTAEQIWPGVQ
jgi:hypothetical protein